ncbi:MAG TPA: hypothetical protein VGD74_09740 [Vulgatibacter sp.]
MQADLFAAPQPLPAKRKLCFFCIPSSRVGWLDEAHEGPCGRPCIGGVPLNTMTAMTDAELDALVARHHHTEPALGDRCPHCEVPHAP